MALPAGVSTATVTVGVPVTFTGNTVKTNITITPSAFLVHTATGHPLVNMIEEATANDGVAVQFTLPHTDQAGFQDEAGNAYQNWYYTATIQYQQGKVTKPPFTKVFQLAVGQTTVDLDLLPSGSPAMPYTAPVATVTSVASKTGAVTALDVINDPASVTALNATYAAVVGVAAPNGTDDTAAFTTAVAALPAAGGTVWLQPGTYKLPTGFSFSKRVNLIGQSAGRNNGSGTVIQVSSATANGLTFTVDASQVQDFAIVNTSAGATAGAGLLFTRGAFAHVDRVLVTGFWNNAQFDQGYYYAIRDSWFLDPVNYGLYMRNTTANQFDHGDQLVSGCVFTPYASTVNPAAGIRWESGGGLKLIGNKINSNGPQPDGHASAGRFVIGIDIAVSDGVSTSVFIIEGNSVEGWSGAGINVHQAGPSNTGTLNKIVITGNEVAANGAGTAIAVNPAGVGMFNNVVVGQNVISNAGTGLLLQNIDTLSVQPNTIRTVGGALSLLGSITDDNIAPQVVTGDNVTVYATQSPSNTGTRIAMQQTTMNFGREVPATTSTTVYSTLWRCSMPNYSSAVVELTIAGQVNGLGQAVWTGRRMLTRGNAGNITATTIGTDATDGFAGTSGTPFDVLFDTTTVAGEVQFKIRLNSVTGGTDVNGRAALRIDGLVTNVKKGQ